MKCLECASSFRWVLLGELRIYKDIIDDVIQNVALLMNLKGIKEIALKKYKGV